MRHSRWRTELTRMQAVEPNRGPRSKRGQAAQNPLRRQLLQGPESTGALD